MVCRLTGKVIGKLDKLLDNTLYCHFSIMFCLYSVYLHYIPLL